MDAEKAKKIAQRLGIPEENIKVFTNQTVKMINKIFREGQRVFSNNAHEKKGRNFLLVYVAGHGVSD